MTDHLSTGERSRLMARIPGRDTAPEKHLRQYLHRNGFRFRLHSRTLPGRPDLVLPRYRAVIFVHGCFWHRHFGCSSAYEPKSRIEFWTRKFEKNIERDRRQLHALRKAGWRLAVVWECGLRKTDARNATGAAVAEWLRSERARFEAPKLPKRRKGLLAPDSA